MAEYIERDAAINSLTEENLVLNLDSVMDGLSNQIKRSAHRILASLPAADVVPVVRCKDCKYSAVDFENMRYCKFVTYYNHVPDDWFCADGERKDGDGE